MRLDLGVACLGMETRLVRRKKKKKEKKKNLESYSTLLTIMAMMMMMVMIVMMMTASNSAPSLHAPSHRGIGWAGGVGREIFLKIEKKNVCKYKELEINST